MDPDKKYPILETICTPAHGVAAPPSGDCAITDAHCRVCKGTGCILETGGPMAIADMARYSLFPRLASARVKRCDACDGAGVWGYER